MNILVVKANNRPASQGVSSRMYDTFMETVKEAKGININVYDVFEEDMPYVGQDLFNAFAKLQKGEPLADIEQRILVAKQKAKDAVSKADVVVIAFPLWNCTIPAALHTFIDYITEAGFTFKYGSQGELINLMPDKKVILLNARGGVYSSPEMQPMEMAVNYMRNMFSKVFGMEIIDEVIIEGHNSNPDQAEAIIEEGLQKVKEVASELVMQLV